MTLFSWPKQAAFGRVVPKSKIYDHAAFSSAVKERFVQQVAQIKWAYKLAPETLNLPATPAVTEIQVFRLTLKGASLDREVLKTIDRAIPFPLIFELVQGERIKLIAAYKRPSQNSKSTADNPWVLGSYFETEWQPVDSPRQPLPVALDMAGLYEGLLNPLISGKDEANSQVREHAVAYAGETKPPPSERLTLEQRIELAEAIATQQIQIERFKTRLRREKQFNKRIAINAELRDAKEKLKGLRDRHERTE